MTLIKFLQTQLEKQGYNTVNDYKDGFLLANVAEVLTCKHIASHPPSRNTDPIKQIAESLELLKSEGVIIDCTAEEIHSGKDRVYIRTLWNTMIQFLVNGGETVIVEWAQEILAKYKISIKKMWDFKDGVAFVFLTHALSGEAFSISEQVPTIDLDSLKSKDPKNTLKTAFRLANTHLGVPITLFPNPDSFDFLSVLFYVSQFMKFDIRNRPDRGSFPQLPIARPSYFEIRKSKSWAWLFSSSKEKVSSSSSSSKSEEETPPKSSKKEKDKGDKKGWFGIATAKTGKEKKSPELKSKTLRLEGNVDVEGNFRGKKIAKRRSEKSRHKKAEAVFDAEAEPKTKGKRLVWYCYNKNRERKEISRTKI